MTSYPGMTLRGEVRESVSLDEDDLSDVEDEVFIRDGKRGYKFAEEVGVKRPLMAPRRKVARPDLTTRLKAKPPCRAFCKPCCYIFAALSILIGLIALVVILTSLFPLPLDKLRDWIVSKTNLRPKPVKMLPCSKLSVTDVWSIKLPKLTSESPIRTLDVNHDGVEDVIFGYGTGDSTSVLQDNVFCPVFLGIAPPCEGGVIALNGRNGSILWRRWMNDSIFSVICNGDVNNDGANDCLVIGKKGNMAMLNSKTGYPIWETTGRLDDIFLANFIPDQDNDTVADILSSHSQYTGNIGHLILLSGKTGNELKRREIGRTYFMPQPFQRDNKWFVLYGTGGPVTGGSLHMAPLTAVSSGNLTSTILYADPYKGMLTQSVLVDITGDKQIDIIAAMYNSTVVAIDGSTLQQIWNYSVPNSESLVVPTPAYFNSDNVTDFLIVYQVRSPTTDNITTQAYIIDGKTGKPIYEKPFLGITKTQTGGLSLRMSGQGNDMFIFWSSELACYAFNNSTNGTFSSTESCNSTLLFKLNAMNQYDQPPGFELYSSEKRKAFEINNTQSALEEAIEFLRKHPENTNVGVQDRHTNEAYQERTIQTKHTYKDGPNFRKTYNRKGANLDYAPTMRNKFIPEQRGSSTYDDYNQARDDINSLVDESLDPADLDYNSYDDSGIYNQNKKTLVDDSRNYKINSRDPRSKEDINESLPEYFDVFTTEEPTATPATKKQKTQKKNLADSSKYGIYDYRNIRNARSRLLHDLSNVPTDILRETYIKDRESQFKKSRFEQRDLQSHEDRMKQNEELMRETEEEVVSRNNSVNLWDLESEKELEDKKNGYVRGKRSAESDRMIFNRVTSTGALTKSTDDTVDIIFFTYWTPLRKSNERILDEHLQKCVNDKLASEEGTLKSYEKTAIEQQATVFMRECEDEYKAFQKDMPYFNQIFRLRLGQMVVYRLRIQCTCEILKSSEKCAKFLPTENDGWTSYLGRNGDGVFH